MKAGVVFGTDDIRYVDWELPEVTPGTVRVAVKSCGVCGSDIPRVLQGTCHSFPQILGHEFSGIVDAVADDVEGFKPGDHVCAIPLVPCMECDDCKSGNYSLCKHYSFVGSRQPGGMAEYVTLPVTNVLKIDETIPFDDAAYFEPCTVAIHAIFLSNFEPGKDVAVLGGGTIGLFALQWLKTLGAKSVTIIGRGKARLELSKQFGADHIVSILDDDYKDQLKAITGGRGFDYVYEIAGSTDAMRLAFDIAGNKSNICFIGTPKDSITFTVKEFENMNRKEFNLTGSWMSYSAPFPGKEWTMTADAFRDGNVKVVPEMCYKRFPLSDIKAAFDEFKIPGQVKGKVLIVND